MAKKKRGKRHARQSRPVRATHRIAHSGNVEPTPETRAKLRPDPVKNLFTKGKIGDQEIRAYEEIQFVRSKTREGMSAPAIDYSRLKTVGGVSGVPEAFLIIKQRHDQWALECVKADIRSNTKMFRVINSVINGDGLRDIEGEIGMRNGSAGKMLAMALAHYASFAGWIRKAA
jgi:hypothetical protein